MPSEPREAFLGQFALFRSLGGEGQGDEADDQRAGFLGLLGHDRARAGTGAAAEAGAKNDHFRAAAFGAQFGEAFAGRGASARGVAPRAEALGHVAADLDFPRGRRGGHRFGIGVHRDKVGRRAVLTREALQHGETRVAETDDFDRGHRDGRRGEAFVGADGDHSPGMILPILLRSLSKTEISSSASCAACA